MIYDKCYVMEEFIINFLWSNVFKNGIPERVFTLLLAFLHADVR